jgi:hypothetical protein
VAAKDFGIDLTRHTYVNKLLREQGEPIPGEPQVSVLVQDQLEHAFQLFRQTIEPPVALPETWAGEPPAQVLEVWEKFADWVHDRELSPEGEQELQQLVTELDIHQVAALIEAIIFMSRFKLEVVDVHPKLTVVWRTIPQE